MLSLNNISRAVFVVVLGVFGWAQNTQSNAEPIGDSPVDTVNVPEEPQQKDLLSDTDLQQAKDLCEERIRMGLEEGTPDYNRCKNIGGQPLRYTIKKYLATAKELLKLGANIDQAETLNTSIDDLRSVRKLCVDLFNEPPFGEDISEYQKLPRKFFETEKWKLQSVRSFCGSFTKAAHHVELADARRQEI